MFFSTNGHFYDMNGCFGPLNGLFFVFNCMTIQIQKKFLLVIKLF